MSNREKRIDAPFVHLLMAFARPCHGEKADCIRHIDKGRPNELEIFIAQLKAIGGNWRVHRTVNARDVEKARKWLLHDLIDHPEHASYIDTQWRTALLQPECIYGEKKFMLDIDTQEEEELKKIEELIENKINKTNENCFSGYIPIIKNRIKSPKGWHFITKPFDTREVCKLPNVTLLRDGYYYVTSVKENNE